MTEARIVEVLVSEESYKYSLFDWDKHSEEVKAEILRDANNPSESYVWRELWLVAEEDNQCMDWTIHELLGRDYHVMTPRDGNQEYDEKRKKAQGLPPRRVAFEMRIPLNWFMYNDHDDLHQMVSDYIENRWGIRGAEPEFVLEPQSADYHDNFTDEVIDDTQWHEEYIGKDEVFAIRFIVTVWLHRFVFAKEPDKDWIDMEGLEQ